jgi:hypothetical protein
LVELVNEVFDERLFVSVPGGVDGSNVFGERSIELVDSCNIDFVQVGDAILLVDFEIGIHFTVSLYIISRD